MSPAAAEKARKVLRTENLVKTYRQKQVVKNVCVDVRQGEIVGLLGPNGAGKTTTFYMVVGMIKPDSGKVLLEERAGSEILHASDISRLPMHERAKLGIGYLAQEASIFRKLSVEDNVMAILEYLPLSQEEREKRLRSLLSEFGVAALAKQKAYTLSGGERRRVEIARALVLEPDFILLDEPFVGIDPIAVLDIQQIIRGLKRRRIGVLITDHNVRETLSITDRAYILYQGEVLLSGKAQALASNEKARKIYLGERFTL